VAAKELCRRYAEYLIQVDIYPIRVICGCSTGSLLMPHLALGKIDKIKVSTSVGQKTFFCLCLSLSKN
jgi:hypothetical protein